MCSFSALLSEELRNWSDGSAGRDYPFEFEIFDFLKNIKS
jgi:hypothetical protein